jgi:hypothetical protein
MVLAEGVEGLIARTQQASEVEQNAPGVVDKGIVLLLTALYALEWRLLQ